MSSFATRSRTIALTGLFAILATAANAQSASSPAPGRELQALSCTNTIPNAAPQGPRQALINCTGDLTFIDAQLLNQFTNKLERVTVTGKSNSAWKTLCIGNECSELLGSEAIATRVSDRFGFGSLYDWFMSLLKKEPIRLAACTPLAIIPDDAKTITSLDDLFSRVHAAGLIIEAHLNGGNFINTNKTEVLITFSDNGTQSFLYNSGNPRAPTPNHDLKVGDGVSRCN